MPSAYLGNPGFIYFLILKEDQEWAYVSGAHAIAVYIPREFPTARLELVAIGT
jgi:predicted component of type VI protein secretion system